jgi:hypothetical protein
MKPIPPEAWMPVDYRDQCLQVGSWTRTPADSTQDKGMLLEQDRQFERGIGQYLWRQGLIRVREEYDYVTREFVRSASLWVLKR